MIGVIPIFTLPISLLGRTGFVIWRHGLPAGGVDSL